MQINGLRNLVFACAAGISSLAFAAPVPSDLSIFGQLSIDTANSLAPIGNANQSGTLTGIVDSLSPISMFSGDPSSTAPVFGTIGNINDGLGALFSMRGTFDGSDATSGPIFADFSFSLSNLSATLTYTLIFHVAALNSLSATGPDAFAESKISVFNSANDELFFSEFGADSLNAGNNFQRTSGNDTFAITLLPSQSTSFTALQSQRGGAYAAGSSYDAWQHTFISLQAIRSSDGGGDNQVPTPGSLALLLAGVTALSLTRRAARH